MQAVKPGGVAAASFTVLISHLLAAQEHSNTGWCRRRLMLGRVVSAIALAGAGGAKYWGGWVSALLFAGASGTMELG